MERITKRVKNAGVETAFFVARDAAVEQKKGRKIARFDIGDMNLPTPKNIKEAAKMAIDNNKTGYTPPGGMIELKEAIAEYINKTRGTDYTDKNVSVQPGAKFVIGKFLMTTVEMGDGVLYPVPGYPIYESQIKFWGGMQLPYRVKLGESGYCFDTSAILNFVKVSNDIPRPFKVILNNFHNPTGAKFSDEELSAIAHEVNKGNSLVLSDEAYDNINYSDEPFRSIASYPGMQDRTVILFTFSKEWAMTGWRMGAAIGPTDIIEGITKMNVNFESCPSTIMQYGALDALTGEGSEEGAREILEDLRDRRDLTHQMVNDIPGLSAPLPETTFYLYADVTDASKEKGYKTLEQFREDALYKAGVSFCTMEHFGDMPDYSNPDQRFYARFSYSGIDKNDIERGLTRLKRFIRGED